MYGSANGEYWGGGGWANGVGLFVVLPSTKICCCLHSPNEFLGMTKILQNVRWSSSEPAQSIWLCQWWGVLRWRWLSTWCGTLPSASTYLNLVASTKWRYFLGTTKLVCELCLYFSVVIRDYTGCIWLSGNDGGTEVVVAEHTMRDSFWCLLTP